MAGDANTPRKIAAKKVSQEVESLKLTAGIIIKATRAYKSPAQPDGARQTDIASKSGLTQSQVSNLENGSYIPNDKNLDDALTACGFDLNKPGAAALRDIMRVIRDKADDLQNLESELPD